MRVRIPARSDFGGIEEQIRRIDVGTANAFVAADQEKIVDLIEMGGGFELFTEQLNERVRAMRRRHARQMLDQQLTDEELNAEPWHTRARPPRWATVPTGPSVLQSGVFFRLPMSAASMCGMPLLFDFGCRRL